MELFSIICRRCYQWYQSPLAVRFFHRLVPYRLWINIILNLAFFCLAYLSSVYILTGSIYTVGSWEILKRTLVPLLLIQSLVFLYHDLYQGLWRFVSFEDLMNIIRASAISILLFIVLGLLFSFIRVDERLYILDIAFCVILVGGSRFIIRFIRQKIVRSPHSGAVNYVILLGPLERVQPLVNEMLNDVNSRYKPAFIVDPGIEGQFGVSRVHDIPVLSVKQILSRQRRLGPVGSIVLCWPRATRLELDRMVQTLTPLNIPFKTIPMVSDILSDRVSISDIREVEIGDLLDRPPVETDLAGISDYLHGKTVLVTGGAGSIGSEICRQVAGFGPKLIVIVERSENSLNDFRLELKEKYPDVPLYASISSINDSDGLLQILKSFEVDVVFHAAAYKHVPLMEEVPVESAYNNIIGTHNVVRAAFDANIERLVMISTDKAVNPTNVMGVTKRIAEMIVQSYNQAGRTRCMVVRFGNVLGSAGSVIPIFKSQIVSGHPVTVTDPEIERYFMTIPEAVQLVLQAGHMGQGGEVFILDMGKPVKILHLAEKLITLSGKRPYDDIPIEFTGLRPGEKMYEELFDDSEKKIETTHHRIKAAVIPRVRKEFITRQIQQIQALIGKRKEAELLEKFCELVPGYQCGCMIKEEIEKTSEERIAREEERYTV